MASGGSATRPGIRKVGDHSPAPRPAGFVYAARAFAIALPISAVVRSSSERHRSGFVQPFGLDRFRRDYFAEGPKTMNVGSVRPPLFAAPTNTRTNAPVVPLYSSTS